MRNYKSYADVTLCKGCRLCIDTCSKGAITPLETVNRKGYPVIEVNHKKCVGCGNCYRICPDYVYIIKMSQGSADNFQP